VDLFELNEAFAAQSLAVIKELGLDATKVGVLVMSLKLELLVSIHTCNH